MIKILTRNKEKRREYIKELCSQQGIDVSAIEHFYPDNFKGTSFDQLVSKNTGLFSERTCYVFHDCVTVLDIKNILKEYSDTENILIFSEESLLKKEQIIFEKSDITIQQFKEDKKLEIEIYNIFTLADLLGKRDKKNLWLTYRQAITDTSPEEIHGILFWQIKNLALVKTSQTNPGLSPYVYSKNQLFVKNFSSDDIKEIAQKMIHMTHKRDTYSTLEIELEKLILAL